MKSTAIVAIAMLFVIEAFAQKPPDPPAALGQIVNWNVFPHSEVDFKWNKNEWTPSNARMTFHKLYDDSLMRCDVMLDAKTNTSASVYAGLFIEGQNRMSQALAGAPAQPHQEGLITFGFSNLFGDLKAGSHEFVVNVAVEDSSPVTFVTTETGIQCYEMLLPPPR